MSGNVNEDRPRISAVQVELVHHHVSETAKAFAVELDALIDGVQRLNNEDLQKRRMSLAFVHFALKTALGITDEEALESLTDGYRDFGIDALHIGAVTEDEFHVTIAQGKYAFDPQQARGQIFPDNEGVNVALPGVRFVARKSAEIPANKRLAKQIARVRALQVDHVPRLTVLLCNNGVRWSDDAQARIDLEDFGDNVVWEHINPEMIAERLAGREPIQERLNWTGKYFIEEFDGIRAIVGRMKVSEIAALVTRCGDSLFDPNVRGFLGLARSRVNKEIQATLSDPAERRNFYLYNNGLTMVCQKVKVNPADDRDLMTPVTGVYVINGGQTCRTIQRTHAEAALTGENLDEATVLVRLYEVPEENIELMSRIALNTNSQNPVDLRDLRSGDSIQRALAISVAAYGYEYHRFRADKIIRGARKISAPMAAESVLCVWGWLPFEAASHKQQHFGDKYYSRIFSTDLTAGQLILAVKILRAAKSRSDQLGNADPICVHGAYVVAAVMGQLLLKKTSLRQSDLQREAFEKADVYFEKNDHHLFDEARQAVEAAILSYQDNDAPYTADALPKLFRKPRFIKGHLLKQIVGDNA